MFTEVSLSCGPYEFSIGQSGLWYKKRLRSPGPDLHGQLSAQTCRASNRSISTEPVINSNQQSQLSVYFYRACYRSKSRPVVGSFLQGQLSVQIYKDSYRSRPTEPIIGPVVQSQLLVQTYKTRNRFNSTGPDISPDLQGQ